MTLKLEYSTYIQSISSTALPISGNTPISVILKNKYDETQSLFLLVYFLKFEYLCHVTYNISYYYSANLGVK